MPSRRAQGCRRQGIRRQAGAAGRTGWLTLQPPVKTTAGAASLALGSRLCQRSPRNADTPARGGLSRPPRARDGARGATGAICGGCPVRPWQGLSAETMTPCEGRLSAGCALRHPSCRPDGVPGRPGAGVAPGCRAASASPPPRQLGGGSGPLEGCCPGGIPSRATPCRATDRQPADGWSGHGLRPAPTGAICRGAPAGRRGRRGAANTITPECFGAPDRRGRPGEAAAGVAARWPKRARWLSERFSAAAFSAQEAETRGANRSLEFAARSPGSGRNAVVLLVPCRRTGSFSATC